MIDEHKDSKCRIFLCYRESGAETAKNYKNYLKSVADKDYGRVWYSDDENIGNFVFDIITVIPQCDYFILFVTDDFTKGFLTNDGTNNIDGFVDYDGTSYGACVTMNELVQIEKERQKRDISIITVNINGSELDTGILGRVFENAGILKDDSVTFYKNLNRNLYIRRQADLSIFADRLSRGMELVDIAKVVLPSSKPNIEEDCKSDELRIITEAEYQQMFSEFVKSETYPVVNFFGYTGQVLSSDLLNYSSRYSLNLSFRILQRNYVIEEKCENEHNQRIKDKGMRLWKKSESIKKMCYEEWTYSMKREIRYYSHQPVLKGTLFSTSAGRAVIGFINFQKWEKMPLSGGSQFKSVPSDMIFINGRHNVRNAALLERIMSQFEYEWSHALSQEEMKYYKVTTTEKSNSLNIPDVIISDFDRTLIYLYRDVSELVKLAGLISNYYSAYTEVTPSDYMNDGYFTWHRLHQQVFDELPVEESVTVNANAERIVAEFEKEMVKKIPIFDGVPETLKKLLGYEIRLAIVSSNSTYAIEDALERYDIRNCFSEVIGREIPFNPLHVKPSPYQINLCVSKMDIRNKTIWYTGDDIVDMKAAKKAHVIAVGIASGKYDERQLYDAGADYCFQSFNDILPYIIKHRTNNAE